MRLKVIKEWLKIGITAGICVLGLYIGTDRMQKDISQETKEYIILGANDLGMHCMQKDYSTFLLLPPANTVKIQVFEKSSQGTRLVNRGIRVGYEIVNNTTSIGKTNFWEYAKDYGFDVQADKGITGNGLKGEMRLSADGKYYEATAIPVTPYDDGRTVRNPYQLAKVTIVDEKTGKEVATTSSIVVPVSDELNCGVCHGEENTDLNILKAHDEGSGTHLVDELAAGNRYKCGDCHQDVAIGTTGKEGIMPLSEAIHGYHVNKMEASPIQDPTCYSCHPGPQTQCYRGVMEQADISCEDPACHGDMKQITDSQKEGRKAWLQEPNCQNCHSEEYSTNPDTLYRNSYLQNGPCEEMNNIIQCESCHNSPHAEWKSTLDLDNQLPKEVQKKAGPIQKCTTCHEKTEEKGKIHQN